MSDGPGSEAFFDRLARRYERTFAPDARATEVDLRSLVTQLAAGATVLDVGCGTGRAWPVLLAAELRVIAMDASAEMLREAERRSSAERVVRLRADLYRPWPVADRSIDAIFALHAVLAHPPGDPRTAWAHVGREIRRVAHEGAILAIDFPAPSWAKRHLEPLGADRYLYRDEQGAEIVALVPEPADVLAALGLSLSLAPCATGVRASGRLPTAPSSRT